MLSNVDRDTQKNSTFAIQLLLCFSGKLASQNSMQRKVKVIKWATDLAVKKKGKGKRERHKRSYNRFARNKFGLTAKLTHKGLIQVTNLFEIGHFRCKNFKFTAFSMKRVCKLEKNQLSCSRLTVRWKAL